MMAVMDSMKRASNSAGCDDPPSKRSMEYKTFSNGSMKLSKECLTLCWFKRCWFKECAGSRVC